MSDKHKDAQGEAPKVHELKTDPDVFAAVTRGDKTHEIRLNDRGFAVGDTLLLRETWYTGHQMASAAAPLVYTGCTEERVISHIQTGYGLADGWCILSFALARRASQVSAAAPEAWKYRVLTDKHTTGKVYPDQFQMHGMWGRSSGWMVSLEKPVHSYMIECIPLARASEGQAQTSGAVDALRKLRDLHIGTLRTPAHFNAYLDIIDAALGQDAAQLADSTGGVKS